jgi:pimeloyl-ACP methyl ester carboxylesterase
MLTRRTMLAGAAAQAAFALTAASLPGHAGASRGATEPGGTGPIVAVHGAWTGGWIWHEVARLLRVAGRDVFTPTLTGLGERVHLLSPGVDLQTHIEDIVNVLAFEQLENVTLVGHSYAGMVITGVAERAPEQIARLVYLDAYVPSDGQSLADLLPEPVREAIVAQAAQTGDGWRVPHNPPDADRRTDFPIAAGLQPLEVRNPAAARLPRAYIACPERGDNPLYLPFIDAAARAQQQGWDYFELPTGHHPMETMPAELSDILVALH